MKTFYLFIFVIYSSIFEASGQEIRYNSEQNYFIHHFQIVKDNDSSYYKVRWKKCYLSKMKRRYESDFVKIETDSLNVFYYRLKTIGDKSSSRTAYVVAKFDEIYVFKEYYDKHHYYLILLPIKLDNKIKNGGHGTGLIVSTNNMCAYIDEKICYQY